MIDKCLTDKLISTGVKCCSTHHITHIHKVRRMGQSAVKIKNKLQERTQYFVCKDTAQTRTSTAMAHCRKRCLHIMANCRVGHKERMGQGTGKRTLQWKGSKNGQYQRAEKDLQKWTT